MMVRLTQIDGKLPNLALMKLAAFHRAGFLVLGFDVDPAKIEALHAGQNYLKHLGPSLVADMKAAGRFDCTDDFARLAEADAILSCVPTPLGNHLEPDLSYVEQTARDIAAYVAREMTSPEGGFYATQDADSEGREGKFFVWTPAEIDAACGGDLEAARVAKRAFDVTAEGNFEGTGASVLSTPDPIERVATALSIRPEAAGEALERARAKMLAARESPVYSAAGTFGVRPSGNG